MKTLRSPFDVSGRGSFVVTEDPHRIVVQQILDICMTNYGDRPFRPTYGANLRSILFTPITDSMLTSASDLLLQLLRVYVVIADIEQVRFSEVSGESSVVRLTVVYRLKPSTQVYTFTQVLSGLVTEETQ